MQNDTKIVANQLKEQQDCTQSYCHSSKTHTHKHTHTHTHHTRCTLVPTWTIRGHKIQAVFYILLTYPTCTRYGHRHRVTCTRGCIDTIDSPDDEHGVARNI